MANVRIDGLKDLGTRVKNMGQEARGAAGQALRKGAEIIREEAHTRAPRSKNGHPATQGRTSKHLADQLTTSVSASKYTAGVTVVGGVNGPSYYWKFLEYGTKSIRERAFIRESADARGEEAMETVKKEIENRLGIK